MIGFISTSVTLSLLINTALSLTYRIHSTPLHTHYDSPSSLVVSWQRSSTQNLALQVTMKSCCFVFNHSALLCPILYSINLHNSLRTRSILVLVLSTAEPSWILFPWRLRVLDSRLLSYYWLQTTFTVPCKPLARTYRKEVTWCLSTVVWRHCLHGSVFTASLPSNRLPIALRVRFCGNPVA
jgi:hypothetical protein